MAQQLFPVNDTPGKPKLAAAWICSEFRAASAEFLGSGSFGETWLVTNGTGPLAVKFITNPNYPVDRFVREAEALRRISHQSVVHLVDVGEIPGIDGNPTPYLKCEYVEGGDLLSHMAKGHWPTDDDLPIFVSQLVGAVEALHLSGVIHRDLKPANLILRAGRYTDPVIVDLGLARVLDMSQITVYPNRMGTPLFMAPEQILGKPATKAADVWSLGVVLYVLVAKRHPFYEAGIPYTPEGAVQRIGAGMLPMPAECPQWASAMISRLLSFEPYRRGSIHRAVQEMKG